MDDFYILAQALVAVSLGGFGGLLGWEREAAGKWAGLRTHMMVCLGVLLFVRLGLILLTESTNGVSPSIIRGDPVRIIEAIAMVIAFLGAGTIIRDRETANARGLTTAASLLVTAAVGIAIAVDRYVVAVGAALLGLFILRTLQCLEARINEAANRPSDR